MFVIISCPSPSLPLFEEPVCCARWFCGGGALNPEAEAKFGESNLSVDSKRRGNNNVLIAEHFANSFVWRVGCFPFTGSRSQASSS
mmetsp:Transcript_33630/g.49437  ORF Transcript_33630/g.49437 Transcript_33630/m.49437 type:complete len:86 (-) Transcript_33630:190-447(-)